MLIRRTCDIRCYGNRLYVGSPSSSERPRAAASSEQPPVEGADEPKKTRSVLSERIVLEMRELIGYRAGVWLRLCYERATDWPAKAEENVTTKMRHREV
jgi:hypothetical protein